MLNPIPDDLTHTLELVHRLRAAQASMRVAERTLWDITRQTANRQVRELM